MFEYCSKAKFKIEFHMRGVIKIWKVLWNSSSMQRTIHPFWLLRKHSAHHLFPEGRENRFLTKLQGWPQNASAFTRASFSVVSIRHPCLRCKIAVSVSPQHFHFGFAYHFWTIKLRDKHTALCPEAGNKWSTTGLRPGTSALQRLHHWLQEATKRARVMFADDTTLGGRAEVLEGRAASLRDHEDQADRNLMELDKDQSSTWHQPAVGPGSKANASSEGFVSKESAGSDHCPLLSTDWTTAAHFGPPSTRRTLIN